ncbi:hypothetical protein ACQY0O_003391 [Thecaphora frezii]
MRPSLPNRPSATTLWTALVSLLLFAPLALSVPAPGPTPAPRRLPFDPTPNDLYDFYSPRSDDVGVAGHLKPSKRQQDQPAVPLASMGPPSFPSNIPSCPKCEADYPNLSHCMGAASAFANSTSIFNSPMAYINVIRCACTDTFQAVFPQCVDCFQHTNQCYYLGTDPQGTGAGELVTNIRNICGFGSALLGGVASANTNIANYTVTAPGTYTDVTATGPGYIDQSTGDIFQSGATRRHFGDGAGRVAMLLAVSVAAVVVGGWRTVAGLDLV